MEDDVALLGAALDIRKPFPGTDVLRPDDAGAGDSRGEVSLRCVRVLPLDAEDAVDISVLMGRQAHVVDVRRGLPVLGKGQRALLEPEPVHPGRAVREGEERLAVGSFDPGDEPVETVPFDGAGIEDGMDPEPFHQEGIVRGAEIVPPFKGGMVGRQDRERIPFKDSVPFDGSVFPFNQLLMLLT